MLTFTGPMGDNLTKHFHESRRLVETWVKNQTQPVERVN